jgi:hypothetical protein
MVDVINYVRARGREFFSERSERRLGAHNQAGAARGMFMQIVHYGGR